MISKIIRDNYSLIVEAIYAHLKKYALSDYLYELQLHVDDLGTVSLKSEPGITGETWNGEYYVLCVAGGGLFTQWDFIGNVFECLLADDVLCVLDELPIEERTDCLVVKRFIKDNYPEWIAKWLDESYEMSYDSGIQSAEEILDLFLNEVEDIDFEDRNDE